MKAVTDQVAAAMVRMRYEQALQASEQRVRRKLGSILSPEGSLGDLNLADIIDVPAVQSLMEDFYKLAPVPMAIIDLKGQVLVGVGWQDVCRNFHRVHPETCRHCIESDTQLTAGVPEGQCKLYKCKNHMWDIATPIMIGGEHMGNLFSGQFFFEGEALDLDLFRAQARQYGFDEDQYLAALEAVPRLSREVLDTAMAFFRKLAQMLSQLSYSNIKLARSLSQRDALTESLRRSECQLQEINQTLERRVAERTAEAEHRAAQLRALAAELSQTEQRERKRIAQILHDHFQQLLVSAKFDLSIVGAQSSEPVLTEDLDRVTRTLDEAIEASRSLAVELSPPVLHDAGLAGGLAWLARWMRDKHGLQVTLTGDPSIEPQDENIRIVLFHAVQELLFNVVKHARTARAAVEVVCDDRHIQITVRDDGTGFDPGLLTCGNGRGGFGLFSIRERLEVLGGALQLHSEPGKGARIVLRIPVDLPAPGPAGQTPVPTPADRSAEDMPAPASKGDRIRVMLADDHPVVRDGLSRLLQMQPDINVVGQASNGREAVELALQARPDVVIMDISMPELNGIEATRRILAQMPHLRVIGLSMHTEGEMAEAMRQAGAAAFLTKTSTPDVLIHTVRAVAGAERAARVSRCCESCRCPGSTA